MVYTINFVIAVVLSFILNSIIPDKKRRNISIALMLSIYAIFLRILCNPLSLPDNPSYAIFFDHVKNISLYDAFNEERYSDWGWGYIFFNWILSHILSNSTLFFIVTAVITIGITFWYYYKTCGNITLPAILYFVHPMLYMGSFFIQRQHLSVACMLLALYHIKNYKISLPLIILSFGMHTSGIIFIPLLLLLWIDVRKLTIVKLFFYTCVFLALSISMIGYLVSYFDRYENTAITDSINNFIPFIWLSSFIIIAFITKIHKRIKYDTTDYYFFGFMIYGFIISAFCLFFSSGGRLTLCFVYLMPVGVKFLFRYNKRKTLNILYALFSLLLVFRQAIISIGSSGTEYDYKLNYEILQILSL